MGRGGHRDAGDDAHLEFLPPDAHAFASSSADGFVDVGDDSRDEFGDEPPRSPWVTFGTAAAVLTLFAIAFIAAAPWSSDQAAAPVWTPTTSTVAVPTTEEPTPTTVLTIDENPPAPELDTGYIAADPPAGFEVRGLYTSSAEHDVVWLELWAGAGATRRKGSWFAAQIDPQSSVPVGSDAERVDLGRNGVGVLTHTADGVAVLTFPIAGGGCAIITSGGLAVDQLVAMAAEMGHVGVRPVFGDETTGDHQLLWSGLVVGSSIDNVYAYGDVRAALRYERRSDRKFISIIAAPTSRAPDLLSKFVLTEDPDFPLSGPSVRIGLNGRQLTAGVMPGLDGARIARWVENGEVVTVLTNLSLAELLDVVASVQGATTEAWRDSMMEARGFRPDVAVTAPKDEVGGGVLDDGATWRVVIDASGNFATIETDGVRSTTELTPHEQPLHLFSTAAATVVLARVPSTAGSGMTLHVNGPLTTVDVGLAPAGAIGTPLVAADAFSEIGPFAAALLDVDGTEVASLARGEPAAGGGA